MYQTQGRKGPLRPKRQAGALTLLLLALGTASVAHAMGDRRTVTEPTTPSAPYCATLLANLPALSPVAFTAPRAFDSTTENTPPDTARINAALDTCGTASNGGESPKVVRLAANGNKVSFLAGPIIVQTGTTLLIDPGVTLYASRNANDYYTSANGSSCGTLAAGSSGSRTGSRSIAIAAGGPRTSASSALASSTAAAMRSLPSPMGVVGSRIRTCPAIRIARGGTSRTKRTSEIPIRTIPG